MDQQYRLYRRDNGVYYIENITTKKQESLRTRDRATARQQWQARNQAARAPHLNVTMARTYLTAKSPELLTRTWQEVLEEVERGYVGSTRARFQKFMHSEPLKRLCKLRLVNTESSDFLATLRHPRAGSSTNVWLRITHNRALDLGWLLAPVLTRRAWPKLRTKRGQAITLEQHRRIVETERESEFALYLQMLWETGGSQTDIACLHRDNVNLAERRITYRRQKLASQDKGVVAIAIGDSLLGLLTKLPKEGALFPRLALQREDVRASRFRKRSHRLGYKGITLHSYRYAWAQRAKVAGMPLREAMAHLGHGSKAVHFAYSEKADVVTLPLEFYEKQRSDKMIAFDLHALNSDKDRPEHVTKRSII